jgi:hypothetical protein
LGHGLLEVFFGNKEHPKVFTLFFSQVFVVYFMRPSNTSGVGVIYVSEPFKALVNKNVVHHKIGDSVGENAESDRKADPEGLVAVIKKLMLSTAKNKKKASLRSNQDSWSFWW